MNTTNGIISQPSPYSAPETIDRLAAVLQAKSITIFARIDQQAEAEKVGLSLRPTQLLLFGNPKAGTPLMVAEPMIAPIDFMIGFTKILIHNLRLIP
jgi:uncharacterized protein (DUF302 family)